jgi:hypothetical protein
MSALDDQEPIHSCPIRDLGRNFQPRSPDDPWRRMPRLFARMVELFGQPFHHHSWGVRIRTEQALLRYSESVREAYGEPCSMDRQRVCARLMMESLADVNVGSPGRFAIAQHRLAHLLDDPRAHEALERTLPEVEQGVGT